MVAVLRAMRKHSRPGRSSACGGCVLSSCTGHRTPGADCASGVRPSPWEQRSEGGGASLPSPNGVRPGGCHLWAEPGAHLGFLLVDVDVPAVSACAHSTGHHVVQLEESAGRGAWRALLSLGPRQGPGSGAPPPPHGTFCRMRFRQTLSSQSMSGSPRPGSFLESRRYTSTSTSTSGSASASCGAQGRGESAPQWPLAVSTLTTALGRR